MDRAETKVAILLILTLSLSFAASASSITGAGSAFVTPACPRPLGTPKVSSVWMLLVRLCDLRYSAGVFLRLRRLGDAVPAMLAGLKVPEKLLGLRSVRSSSVVEQ